MKRPLLTATLLSVMLGAQAQTFKAWSKNPNVYRTHVDFKVIRVADNNYKALTTDTFNVKVLRGAGRADNYLDYKIISENENGYTIIQFIPHAKYSTESETITKTISKGYLIKNGAVTPVTEDVRVTKTTKTITFSDSQASDADNATLYYHAVKSDGFKPMSKVALAGKLIGVPILHPFKLRPRHSDVGGRITTGFSVSYNFGIRFHLGKNPFAQNYITFIPYGAGIGPAKYFTQNPDRTLTEEEDQAAITYYQGGVLLTVQKVNFGVFAGGDAMIASKNDWFYQSKPWVSFGIGYKFSNE